MKTTKQPLITVVMPNYNGHRFVEQAIDSVLNQTYQNFELLVVDDCSKDDSLQLIQRKAQSDKRIRVIALEHNAGVANVRNRGIKEAKGKYIALLDNDDLWTKDKLERQLAIAERGADIVYCSYDFIDEQNKTIKKPFIVPQQTNFNKMLASSVISCSSVCGPFPMTSVPSSSSRFSKRKMAPMSQWCSVFIARSRRWIRMRP